MPMLKNITTKNMIPIIDFEEYNTKLTEEQKERVELKYFLVHFSDIIPKMAGSSASTLLLRFPSYINDEVTFHQFPSNNYIEMRDLKMMINSQSE